MPRHVAPLLSLLFAACAGAGPVAPAPIVPPAAPTPARADAELDRVRELLRERRREVKSSKRILEPGAPPPPPSATDRLRELGAMPALVALLRAHDPDVTAVGGVFFGILVQDLDGASLAAPALVDQLTDADPVRAAFACDALGYLGWADARVHLQALRDDPRPVPGFAGEPTVGWFADQALQLLDKTGR